MTHRDEFLLGAKVDDNTDTTTLPGGRTDERMKGGADREPMSARDEDRSVTCTAMRAAAALNYFRSAGDCAVKGRAGTWGAAGRGGKSRGRDGEIMLSRAVLFIGLRKFR